jgi:quercetin dioxygenase-like cupin family protein
MARDHAGKNRVAAGTAAAPGAEIAVLEGDPAKPGFFTMRLKMPDGYRIPAHSHSQPERVTVLSGTLYLGLGDGVNAASAIALSAGSYSSMPPKMVHFGWMKGETILQLTSIGPWTVTYVNPRDDPRKASK